MTFDKQLSFKSVTRFMQPINEIVGNRLRTLVKVLLANVEKRGLEGIENAVLDWVIWLLDRMDEHEIGSVDFKPNRLLMFDGRIPHGAEAPHESARYIDRKSIVIRGDEIALKDERDIYADNRV